MSSWFVDKKNEIDYSGITNTSPFVDIVNRDKTENKDVAKKELIFIELYASISKKNPYKHLEENSRLVKLKKDLSLSSKWKIDQLIKKGIEKIKEYESTIDVFYLFEETNRHVMKQILECIRDNALSSENLKSILEADTDAYERLQKVKILFDGFVSTLKNCIDIGSKYEIIGDRVEETLKKKRKEFNSFAHGDNIS